MGRGQCFPPGTVLAGLVFNPSGYNRKVLRWTELALVALSPQRPLEAPKGT